jgi:arginine vasopressin/oxytocin-neurophysin 1
MAPHNVGVCMFLCLRQPSSWERVILRVSSFFSKFPGYFFQCMSCAQGAGICAGPDICCGPEIGCHMGTKLSSVCAKENESTTACTVPGRQCGPNNEGKCVANGICCTSGKLWFIERLRTASYAIQICQNTKCKNLGNLFKNPWAFTNPTHFI